MDEEKKISFSCSGSYRIKVRQSRNSKANYGVLNSPKNKQKIPTLSIFYQEDAQDRSFLFVLGGELRTTSIAFEIY